MDAKENRWSRVVSVKALNIKTSPQNINRGRKVSERVQISIEGVRLSEQVQTIEKVLEIGVARSNALVNKPGGAKTVEKC